MTFDVAVVGAGPGGYVCAIRAAQLGFRVAIVENRATLGGTCLNVGCIPSKALLRASAAWHEAGSKFADMGVMSDNLRLDLGRMLAYKDSQVDALTGGVAFLMKRNRIEWVRGRATLEGTGRLSVAAADGGVGALAAKHIVLAPGSVPASLPGVEVGVFDPETRRALDNDQTGELGVRGPNVFGGYWQDAEATAAAFDGDWFRTGDLGAVSDDGYVSILGRMKELIIVGGTNVTPGEVEAVLELEAGVHECAVAGLPDPDLGEIIAAFIVPRQGHNPAAVEARLRARVKQDLAPYKRPRHYCFLDEIPRNTMGKVQKNRLREEHGNL